MRGASMHLSCIAGDQWNQLGGTQIQVSGEQSSRTAQAHMHALCGSCGGEAVAASKVLMPELSPMKAVDAQGLPCRPYALASCGGCGFVGAHVPWELHSAVQIDVIPSVGAVDHGGSGCPVRKALYGSTVAVWPLQCFAFQRESPWRTSPGFVPVGVGVSPVSCEATVTCRARVCSASS